MMIPKASYERLSRCIPYEHLCLLEDILARYTPRNAREQRLQEELKETVTTARSWAHQMNRTDRR